MATVKVKSTRTDGRVAFFERSPAHPSGAAFVRGDGQPVEVAETRALKEAIRRDRVALVQTQVAPVSRAQGAPQTPPATTQGVGAPLAGLSLTAEQQKALADAGYGTRAKLSAATDEQLTAVPTVGKATVEALRKALAAG